MYHVTQAKREIELLLAQTLPDVLRRADEESDDGVTTPPPNKIFRCAKADLEQYPALEIVIERSSPQLETDAQVYRHRFVLGFTLAGDDEQTLQDWVERYMWAIRLALRDVQLDPPGGTATIDTGEEQYAPLVQRQGAGLENPFVTGGFIEFFVLTVGEFGSSR